MRLNLQKKQVRDRKKQKLNPLQQRRRLRLNLQQKQELKRKLKTNHSVSAAIRLLMCLKLGKKATRVKGLLLQSLTLVQMSTMKYCGFQTRQKGSSKIKQNQKLQKKQRELITENGTTIRSSLLMIIWMEMTILKKKTMIHMVCT